MIELETTCPHCGKKLDRHQELYDKEATPTPGAIAICVGCHTISIFDDDLHLRKLTPIEQTEVAVEYPNLVVTLAKLKQ